MSRSLVLLMVLSGCVGSIGGGEPGPGAAPGTGDPARPGGGTPGGGTPGGGTPGGGTPGGGTPGGPGPGAGDPLAAGSMPLRRLTVHEYRNTLRDLLGASAVAAVQLEAGSDRDPGFGFRRPGVISTLESERLRDTAEAVAAAAVKNPGALLPCTPAAPADEAACARRFAAEFGLRAYRRPPTTEEIDRLLALYQAGRTQMMLPFAEGIGLMLEAMLQSAPFLYRWELGAAKPIAATDGGSVLKLGPYELASRLSYFLWSTMPDKALFDAAAANQLGTAAQVDSQVRRMLKDPKARDAVVTFFEEWLDLESLEDRSKDPMLYPEFNDALKAAMLAETRAFVNEVMFNGDRKLTTLLTAPFSMVDGALARLYGAAAPAGATGMTKVNLDPKQRAGLFTQAGFLALSGSPDGSNPIIRGRDIYLHVLCKSLPPPPPEVPAVKPPSATGTTRQRFEEHANQECAAGCHKLFDPFGFAFEHYDGIGKYRTTDNGQPVDASGKVTLDGVEHSFTDARGLMEIVTSSAEARRCFATQWLRYGFRRGEEPGDDMSLRRAVDALSTHDLDVGELLVGLATSRTFTHRRPSDGEVLR